MFDTGWCFPFHYARDEPNMAAGDVVPILGGFIIFGWTIFLFQLFVIYPWLRRRIRQATGVSKVLVATHGTKSWDQIEREFTENYRAGVRPEAVLDLIADAYENDTIEDLEKKNPFAGSFNPKSEFQNSEALGNYYKARADPTLSSRQRDEFLDKQSTALALAIVLNLIRQGSLKREQESTVR